MREALFSVVKGGTCLGRFFCKTGRLLICLGKRREEGENGQAEREGERTQTRGRRNEKSLHREEEDEVRETECRTVRTMNDGGEKGNEVWSRNECTEEKREKCGKAQALADQSQTSTPSICPKTSP